MDLGFGISRIQICEKRKQSSLKKNNTTLRALLYFTVKDNKQRRMMAYVFDFSFRETQLSLAKLTISSFFQVSSIFSVRLSDPTRCQKNPSKISIGMKITRSVQNLENQNVGRFAGLAITSVFIVNPAPGCLNMFKHV